MPSTRNQSKPEEDSKKTEAEAEQQQEQVDDRPEEEAEEEDQPEEEDDSDKKRKASDEMPEEKSPKKARLLWTAKEDDDLLKAVVADRKKRGADEDAEEDDEDDWDEIAKVVPGKTPVQSLRRYMRLNDAGVEVSGGAADDSEADSKGSGKKKPRKEPDLVSWSGEEIELLRKLVEAYSDCKYTSSSSSGGNYIALLIA
jgi:hypothetical protein